MKFNIKEEPNRSFYGYSEVIDLNTSENTPFSKIWSISSQEFDMKYYQPGMSSIGLEVYPHNFMDTRQFIYSALFPISTVDGLDSNKIFTLEAGRFIRFETTFEELVKGFIPKVYQYIKEHNIPISYEYDYEEYPSNFDHANPDSIVYVCFEYKGEE